MADPHDFERQVFVRVHLDANRINSRQRIDAVNQLEKWHHNELIELFMSQTAHDEARAGTDAVRTRKALGYIYSMSMATTAGEQKRLREVEAILAEGGPVDSNTQRDAEIAFNAGKYMAVLATADRKLLRHRGKLAELGIRVMTDDEVVDLIRHKIVERDELARTMAREYGKPIPSWVGSD